MATTTRKRSTRAAPKTATKTAPTTASRTGTKHGSNGRFVSSKSHATRNIALGTAAVAGAAVAGALFAAWRSNAFADLFERDLITGDRVQEARDTIKDDDRDQFAPATVPLRDSKYDRELAN